MASEYPGYIRGYMNLLFGRGIYDGASVETCEALAREKGKKYAILLRFPPEMVWNLSRISQIDIYDAGGSYIESVFPSEDGIFTTQGGNP